MGRRHFHQSNGFSIAMAFFIVMGFLFDIAESQVMPREVSTAACTSPHITPAALTWRHLMVRMRRGLRMMMMFIAGDCAALLLVTRGLFWWYLLVVCAGVAGDWQGGRHASSIIVACIPVAKTSTIIRACQRSAAAPPPRPALLRCSLLLLRLPLARLPYCLVPVACCSIQRVSPPCSFPCECHVESESIFG